ncbi:hypothetical protein ACFSHQ_19655 [Gemmobacter lanyuensis]
MAAAIGKAEQDLEKALVACGAESLIRARQGLAETQRLDAAIAQAEALLREVAPEGADALRQALALADQQARDLPEDAGDPEALTAALGQAEQAETEALAAAKAAHELAVGAGVTHAEAEGERRTAERRAAEALEEAGEATALAAQIATLGARALPLPLRVLLPPTIWPACRQRPRPCNAEGRSGTCKRRRRTGRRRGKPLSRSACQPQRHDFSAGRRGHRRTPRRPGRYPRRSRGPRGPLSGRGCSAQSSQTRAGGSPG